MSTRLADPGEPAPPPRRRWIHTLLAIVVVGMLIDIAIGITVHVSTGRFPLLPVMGTFLVLSGIRLVGVAIDTAQRTQDRAAAGAAARSDDFMIYGWGWVAYKLVAAAVAFAGAAYLLFAPDAARLERFLN